MSIRYISLCPLSAAACKALPYSPFCAFPTLLIRLFTLSMSPPLAASIKSISMLKKKLLPLPSLYLLKQALSLLSSGWNYTARISQLCSSPVTQTSDLTKNHSRLEKSRQMENESLLEKKLLQRILLRFVRKVSCADSTYSNKDFSASL